MNNNDKKARRGQSAQLVEHMLEERRELLTLLLRLSGLRHTRLDAEDQELLEEFCQVLVDYIAAGHFGLYERIASGSERRREVAELAKQIYPALEQTTEISLRFADKYKPRSNHGNSDDLASDLSRLGETVTARLELEDQLLTKLLL